MISFFVLIILMAMVFVNVNRKRRYGSICAVPGCRKRQGSDFVSFHLFPSQTDRCTSWVNAIGRPDLAPKVPLLHTLKHMVVCSEHFAANNYLISVGKGRRLRSDAIPEQNLNLPTASTSQVPGAKLRTDLLFYKKKVADLRREYRVKSLLHQSRLERALHTIRQLRRSEIMKIQEAVTKKATSAALSVVQRQLQLAQEEAASGKRPSWSKKPELQDFALSLFHLSATCYRQLLTQLHLPSIATLRRLTSEVLIEPGFCNLSIQQLQSKLSAFPSMHKLHSLSFDSMSVNEELRYVPQLGRIEGFANLGQGHLEEGQGSPGLANQCYVFMLRGIFAKWNAVVGYFFWRDCIPGRLLKELIDSCLAKVFTAGLKTVAIICDQGSAQWKLLKDSGVTHQSPYLDHPVSGHRVYVIPDPPHLLKNSRNALRHYIIRSSCGRADWADIIQLFKVDQQKGGDLRLCKRLTYNHIYLPSIGMSMQVALAAQVFSNTVGSALRHLVESGHLRDSESNRPSETGVFCQRMNALFDLFNTGIRNAYHMEKRAICKEEMEKIIKELDGFYNWVDSWRYEVKSHMAKPKTCMPHKDGWGVAIRALQGLLQDLFQVNGVEFISTCRFTQDHVENTFSKIRAANGGNTHPSTWAARSGLKKAACSSMMRVVGRGKNCIETDDYVLSGYLNVLAKRRRSDDRQWAGMEVAPSSVQRTNPCRSSKKQANFQLFGGQERPDSIINDIMDHIGGYLVRRCPTSAECLQCTDLLLDLSQDGSQTHRWINWQEKQPGHMTRPTASVVKLVLSAERYFRRTIGAVAHLPNLKDRLLRCFRHEPLPETTCGHQLAEEMLNIYFQTRLKCWCLRRNEEHRNSRRWKSLSKLRKLGVAVRRQ